MPRAITNRQEWQEWKDTLAFLKTATPEQKALYKELVKEKAKRHRQERNRMLTKPDETEEARLDKIRKRSKLEDSYHLIRSGNFEENLRVGKIWEKNIADLLISYGYNVTDISERQFTTDGQYWHYYPFDLCASFGNLKFLIDVKFRTHDWSLSWIYTISKRKLSDYLDFKDIDAKDRLLVIAYPKSIVYYDILDFHKDEEVRYLDYTTTPIVYLRKRLEAEYLVV